MKKIIARILIALTVATLACGGDAYSSNCGDEVLQEDELCEVGMYTTCDAVGYRGSAYQKAIYCDDSCKGWDVSDCTTEGE